MNDARVFALESRMESEEEVRVTEVEFMKDLMRKLVYSLEQLSIQHLDSSTAQREASILPNLLTPNQQSGAKKEGMEIMMMKRMNYIRNNLDQLNPRETTSKIR